MAHSSSLAGICLLLVLFHGSLAQIEQVTGHSRSEPQQRQQQRLQTECQIDRLNAVPPHRRVQSEGGVSEFWNQFDQQFRCAGVAAIRHRINPRGLLLPAYTNAPELIYVVRGRGVQGAIIPGCAETYQSLGSTESHQQPRDQHQKIRHFREGDILALPTGTADWIYNDGGSELVLVKLVDVGNQANQLDENFRKFFLAGNPEQEVVTGGQCSEEGESLSPREESEGQRQSRRCRGGQRRNGNNILSGFDPQLLAETMNIDQQLARKLQNQEDMRGAIVRVERELEFLSPRYQKEVQERRERYSEQGEDGKISENGLEETFCTMRLRHRIDDPSHADVFNPRGGRISTVDSYNLPILQFLRLSAERGVLYKNAMYTPHWNRNAHSIMYVTRGNGQLQVVREDGETVFNGRVEEGQMIVVPQHFAVVKRAGDEGLEWISFKTNSNAKISQIAGRVSVLRGIPVDVLANSYRISREEARRLKENREEVSVLSPSSRASRD